MIITRSLYFNAISMFRSLLSSASRVVPPLFAPVIRRHWKKSLAKSTPLLLSSGLLLSGYTIATTTICDSSGGYTHTSAYDIPIGKDFPNKFTVFIEVAKGSRHKYEFNNNIGFLQLDRVLSSAVFYPWNYGFVGQTLCGDGDPLDVLVIGGDAALLPGCVVEVRPIAYLMMEDEKGFDEKVLAVMTQDPRYENWKSLNDVPEAFLREINAFFETLVDDRFYVINRYKRLEKEKWVRVGGWKTTEDTKELLLSTHQSYLLKKHNDQFKDEGNKGEKCSKCGK